MNFLLQIKLKNRSECTDYFPIKKKINEKKNRSLIFFDNNQGIRGRLFIVIAIK